MCWLESELACTVKTSWTEQYECAGGRGGAAAHRTSAVDACYMEAYRLAGLRTPSRLHSVDGLPWFTFLRFFGGFAGASELVALGVLFAGEWALDTSLSGATLSLSVSLDSAMLSGEAPFDRRAASVIKCG